MLASLILVGGSLGDKLGRKKVFMAGIVIFIVASCALRILTVGHLGSSLPGAAQGSGRGTDDFPVACPLSRRRFIRKKKGKAIGTWSAVTTLVTVGGPILGGAFRGMPDSGGPFFYINVPLGIAALIVLARKVPESSDDQLDHRLDYGGAITIALGLALLTFGFLEIPELGWTWPVYASLAGGVTDDRNLYCH